MSSRTLKEKQNRNFPKMEKTQQTRVRGWGVVEELETTSFDIDMWETGPIRKHYPKEKENDICNKKENYEKNFKI